MTASVKNVLICLYYMNITSLVADITILFERNSLTTFLVLRPLMAL